MISPSIVLAMCLLLAVALGLSIHQAVRGFAHLGNQSSTQSCRLSVYCLGNRRRFL